MVPFLEPIRYNGSHSSQHIQYCLNNLINNYLATSTDVASRVAEVTLKTAYQNLYKKRKKINCFIKMQNLNLIPCENKKK